MRSSIRFAVATVRPLTRRRSCKMSCVREEKEKGRDARQHLQFKLLTTDQLEDVMAALAFLKTVPGIDIHRIAVAGNSFGGQITLLAAERDSTIRAVVTFAAAAGSWEHSAELRDRLFTPFAKRMRR